MTTAKKTTRSRITKAEKEASEAAKADVQNILAEMEKLTKADADKIQGLQKQGLTEADKIKPVAEAVKIRMKIKEAAAAALQREPKGAEVVVRKATEDVTTIDGYADIVDNAASKVAEGIKADVSAHEVAYKVAEAILDGRLRIINKGGLPDLKGTRQASKDLASHIYQRAAEKLHEEGWVTDRVDFETLMQQLQNRVRYQMTAVLPAFIRSLDNSPEEFKELFPSLAEKAEKEGAKPSEVVFKHYDISKKSKAELAAEKRARKKAVEQGNAPAGELTTEAEPEVPEAETQFDKDSRRLTRIINELPVIVSHSRDYNDEEKERLRDQLTQAVAKLSEALAKL